MTYLNLSHVKSYFFVHHVFWFFRFCNLNYSFFYFWHPSQKKKKNTQFLSWVSLNHPLNWSNIQKGFPLQNNITVNQEKFDRDIRIDFKNLNFMIAISNNSEPPSKIQTLLSPQVPLQKIFFKPHPLNHKIVEMPLSSSSE